MQPTVRPRRRVTRLRARRGSALLLVLLMTMALAALAGSAIYLSSGALILTKRYDREREFRYAAEAALAIGKSRLSNDTALVLADSGYTTLLRGGGITGADGTPVPGVAVNLYVGRTGSTTGQFGLYESLVAEARDSAGSRYVRRLEVAEENFARFLDWSASGATGCYGKGEIMSGPVFSNANIDICTGSWAGARFTDDVATAGVVNNASSATFKVPPKENQKSIALPNTSRLSRLASYAAGANFSFTAPNAGAASGTLMRVEFVPIDLDLDNDSTDEDEGFFRVFVAFPLKNNALRADYTGSVATDQCGDWHYVLQNGAVSPTQKFFPASVHNSAWFRSIIGDTLGNYAVLTKNFPLATYPTKLKQAQAADAERMATTDAVMGNPNARCFLAGDPHLVATERDITKAPYVTLANPLSAIQKGGDDTTFTPGQSTQANSNNKNGYWLQWPGAVPGPLTALASPSVADGMKPFFFPLFRGYNAATKGVIYVSGTTGVSGVLRGRVTLYATGTVVFLDDMTYQTNPASNGCADLLGIIAGNDAIIADNAINTPQRPGTVWRFMDDNRDFYLHGVVMALNKSFMPENYLGGPGNATTCGGQTIGRGCLYQIGGSISKYKDATAAIYTTSNVTGFLEQRSYDRCMMRDSPPYFPTTGRFLDNRYYEIDPARFDVDQLFHALTANP